MERLGLVAAVVAAQASPDLCRNVKQLTGEAMAETRPP
jgi:hypothetical protein